MENRLAKAKDLLRREGLDGLLVQSPANRRYLSGFTGTAGSLLITEGESIILTDFRYTRQAKEQCALFTATEYKSDVWEALSGLLKEHSIKRMGFEDGFITYRQYLDMKKRLEGADTVPVGESLNLLRMVKDDSEMRLMRKAAEISEKALEYAMPLIRPGTTEREISKALVSYMIQAGCSGPAFEFIVASGWRSAMPHGVASDKEIEYGDFVTIDFGGKYQGYCSDMTRTFVVGRCSPKQKEVYDTVLTAQLTAIERLRAGITGREADEAARSSIEKAGYGRCFGHGLGHGVGLKIHEAPALSPRGDIVLKPGMAVTVEPGVYIEGFGGVRIEDLVIVKENGVENLNSMGKELIVL
ncbi:MAG: M24 family metallopeptidase [Clostridia bacterium]|nr:aminopeptidase P family protein [Clostridiales bacterium]